MTVTPKPVRRIVTGHDDSGKAVVVMDGAAPNQRVRAATGLVSTLLWVTDESPVNIASNADRADRESPVAPPPRGSILRVVDFPPAGDTSGIMDMAISPRAIPSPIAPRVSIMLSYSKARLTCCWMIAKCI